MGTYSINFAYDGKSETALCNEINEAGQVEYHVTPHNKVLIEKFGKNIFKQMKGGFLSGEPINDLEYYSALKEGLETFIYQKRKE